MSNHPQDKPEDGEVGGGERTAAQEERDDQRAHDDTAGQTGEQNPETSDHIGGGTTRRRPG